MDGHFMSWKELLIRKILLASIYTLLSLLQLFIFKNKIYHYGYYLCKIMFIYVSINVHIKHILWKPVEGIGFSEGGVTGVCEMLSVSTGIHLFSS